MDYKEAMEYLRKNGKEIARKALEGNVIANEVRAAYNFHWKCPDDSIGKTLLPIAVKKYIEAMEEKKK